MLVICTAIIRYDCVAPAKLYAIERDYISEKLKSRKASLEVKLVENLAELKLGHGNYLVVVVAKNY